MVLRAKRVDGVIISCSLSINDLNYYKLLSELGLPIVFFDRGIREIGISCIGVNDKTAMRQLTEPVISKGDKQIVYLSCPKQVSIGKDRFEGFLEAIENYQLEVDLEYIIENGFNEKGGHHAMSKLLTLPAKKRPKALVALNNPVAFGAMKAIREAGLGIPEDIVIVGFTNDIRASLVNPALTTVHQPAYEDCQGLKPLFYL